MILSRRLDVLDIKEHDYIKNDYFKGLQEFLDSHKTEMHSLYTLTYCDENSWVPLSIIIYKDTPRGVEELYESINEKLKDPKRGRKGLELLKDFMLHHELVWDLK